MKEIYHPATEQIKLSVVLYALSDPTRLSIVRNLAAREGESCCGEFTVAVAKSTVSHHFRVLRESGLIKVRLEGTQRFVSLRCDDIEQRFPGLLAAVLNSATEQIK
jgi:DNA-binding transcriptional ArsR family regulator